MPWREMIAEPPPKRVPQFGGWAGLYQRFRPHYPAALFSLLANVTPRRDVCVELGAGTGQATRDLATMFESVIAVEPDREMAALIAARPGLSVIESSAESALIAPGTVDAVVAATALHWMDVGLVLSRAATWLKSGGVFFACTFATSQYPGAPPAALAVIQRYGKMWREHTHERLSCWRPAEDYLTLASDYQDVQRFEIYADFRWSAAQVAGFLMTTSVAQAFAADDAAALMRGLREELEAATGSEDLLVRFPIEGAHATRKPHL